MPVNKTLPVLALSSLIALPISQLSAVAAPNPGTSADETVSSNIATNAAAHWLDRQVIALPSTYRNNRLALKIHNKNGKKLLPLTLISGSDGHTNLPRHLATFDRYSVTLNDAEIKHALKSAVVVERYVENTLIGTSTVQTAAIIDQLFTADKNDANEVEDYGATLKNGKTKFKLWAPTALNITVNVYDSPSQQTPTAQFKMTEDSRTGVWSTQINKSLNEKYYQYQITLYHPQVNKHVTLKTTDPYSLSLSTNSQMSQVIDLTAPSTMPNGWLQQADNIVEFPEDNIFYETHIRDFSAFDNTLSDQKNRGKYGAFSEKNSDGIKHLKKLKNAGINSIHLLPAFDIGTVNEKPNHAIALSHSLSGICQRYQTLPLCNNMTNQKDKTLSEYLSSLPKNGQRQAVIESLREFDDYNWGYDPFHYSAPEGSYAKNPDGVSRIKEFRQMVQSIHNMGFRVIMDVVYNHTHQAGLSGNAVLDKIVPNYYHRLSPITGNIEQSTCCDNTATEHAMMEKLMGDSLVVWAKHYKIDGFRFDLMAHQPKAAMLKARQKVQAIDEDNYFYGEGWNFGEVANNAQFTQASQLELAGTEIGTFTDRLRDAVRGGAFTATGDDIRRSQGIGNGLADLTNELNTGEDLSQMYHLFADQIRIGLTGNLANFPLIDRHNNLSLGKNIPYGDQPTGYALDPADTINYVSKHDNQTLWDNNQYRLPYSLSTADRARFQLLSLSYPLFAQGIPFIHMGSELLRSKSFLRDSYDYGDWYNRVDFSATTNNYNVGLPPAAKDQANWPLIKTLLANNERRDHVSAKDIALARDQFLDFVAIRMSSNLFRLTSAEAINAQVSFLNTGENQQHGLIAMRIMADNSRAHITQRQSAQPFKEIIVLFNASGKKQQLDYKNTAGFTLHEVQANGSDQIVKQSIANAHGFEVPAITTAVFVKE